MIDEKIKPLYNFLNSLDGVETVGSCQGHPDSKNFDHPYITFHCDNVRSLGLIAKIVDSTYEIERFEQDNLDDEEREEGLVEWFLEDAPSTKADWSIGVLPGHDATLLVDREKEYVLYDLSPIPWSYDNVEETWDDSAELVRFGEYLIKEHME